MTTQGFVIEDGVPLPPPTKPGGRALNSGMLGQFTGMLPGQSVLLALPPGRDFYSWRQSVATLSRKAALRMQDVRFVSRRDGDAVRIFCVAAEG